MAKARRLAVVIKSNDRVALEASYRYIRHEMGRLLWTMDEVLVVGFVFLLAFGAFRPLADTPEATAVVAALTVALLAHTLRRS